MKKLSTADYDNLLVVLENIDHRLYILEVAIGLVEKSCKVCDNTITIKNACWESLLAELCDECWEKQNSYNPEEVE